MINGIDISAYQSSTYDTTGLEFVFIKATEGRSYVNLKQNAQADTARQGNCVVGFYHFLWPGNIKEQAAYFVEKCDSVEGDILWVDWEHTGDGTAATCAEKDAFIAEVKRLRPTHKVGLYCNRDFWLNHDTTSNAGDALWIADYVTPGQPRIEAAWMFHQYTSTPIDKNVSTFDSISALRQWAGYPGSNPEPAPAPTTVTLDLSQVVTAFKKDAAGSQGHTTHKSQILVIERALAADGYLDKKWVDGSAGTKTREAYAKFQKAYSKEHHLGWTGDDVNGIPGMTSLTALGKRHNFKVKG